MASLDARYRILVWVCVLIAVNHVEAIDPTLRPFVIHYYADVVAGKRSPKIDRSRVIACVTPQVGFGSSDVESIKTLTLDSKMLQLRTLFDHDFYNCIV